MKRLLLSLLLLCLATLMFSVPVTTTQAIRVAENWMLERTGQNYANSSIMPLTLDSRPSHIYVVSLYPQGYVLVAGDDAANPIIGHNTSHNWGEYEIPEQLASLLINWQEQMREIVNRNLAADISTSILWRKYDVSQLSFTPNRSFRDVSPLITSIWGQGTYYNAQCPSGTPVGCVATAMAQIMRYWAFPTIGQGSHSYNHPVYGTQSADFGSTVYNWAAMPNAVNSANSAVATICRHAGVAVDMDYAPDGSGAYSTDVPSALINYFKYKNTTTHRNKSSYSAENWDILMRGELNNSRPVYYSGYSTGSGGHAWVIDGYQGSYPTTTYHVNWGWYGYYNGYYTLTALNPGTDSFNSGQAAVTGIEPSGNIPTLSEGFEGTTFPPTDWTRSDAAWARTTNATYLITGTAAAMCSGTGNQNNKRLRTPLLTIDGTIPLTFKGKRGSTNYSEAITVQYSANGTTWTSLGTYTLTATVQTFTQSLASLTPGDYYLGFLTANATTVSSQTKRFVIDDVSGPTKWVSPTPQAAININAWAAGDIAPGEAVQSGAIFQLANVAGGTLQITGVTDLSATEFSSTLNTGVQLVTGQIHEFGFVYEPLNYGADNVSYVIQTNGGNITITLSGSGYYAMFSDGFESYSDFALSFPPWTQSDGDGRTTYSITNVTFPNQGYTGSFIIFNPSTCTPSQSGTALDPQGGAKGAYCFAATTPPNNDWLISPQLTLSSQGTLKFWAKSYTDQYGLERFKVLYSTTTNAVASFTNYLAGSAGTWVNAPITWTQYTYTLPQTARYFAIQCVSNDAFVFMVDNVSVSDSSAPPAPLFGHLSGYVYESGTTNPIANALVQVGTKQAYTNGSGFYQINNLIVGTYSAVASAPGRFYFNATASGIGITQNNTTSQNFYLTWAEMAVAPSPISASVYSSETAVVPMTISNPAGTANLQYEMFFSSASTAQGRTEHDRKAPPSTTGYSRPFNAGQVPLAERAEGWAGYADPADANYYTYPIPERAVKFTLEHFGMFAQGVTISNLRHYFYDVDGNNWGGSNTYTFKIYAANGTTVLYTSPTLTAVNWPTANEHILTTPITVTGDFYVSVVPGNQTSGAPYSIGTDAVVGHTYVGSSGSWTLDSTLDIILMAYINGDEWVEASQYSGTVAPGITQNINVNFNSNGLTAGTHNAYLHIYNNSNYIAPSPNPVRGDVMVVPVTLQVTIPTTPTAILNRNTWTTNTMTGSPSSSGAIFQLKNVGQGNLTITSASGLAGTPFSTTFNSSVVLAQNQTHDFSFTFNPTANGVYNATFTIVTNGGTKTVTLKGYANYIAEGFEGATFPPDGWVALDQDADTYNWYQYTATGAALNGAFCAGSASWISTTRDSYRDGYRPALTPDNWLITPRLAIANGDVINWWIAAQDPAWPAEYYSVMISTTNSAPASFTTTLFSETLTNGDWQYRTLDLSAYAGQSVFIAFRHHNCTDQFVLKLDDVLMPPLAAPLVYGNITGRVRKAGTDQNLANVTVSVAGRTAVTAEDGNYTLNNIVVDSYPITATATGYVNYSSNVTLLANQTITHNIFMDYAQFSTPATTINMSVETGATTSTVLNLSNIGTVAVDWTADSGIWGGDSFPAGPFYEDFEDLDISGWVGSVGAYSDIYTGYGYNSQNNWVFASNETPEAQWIATPKIRVQTGDNLSFWYKQFNSSSETFSVLISTTDNTFASFTNTLATVGPLADTNWAQFNQSLNAYAGMDIYIAFYYPRVDAYQYGYILIDDVAGGTAVLPPAEWLSSTVSGTLNAGQSVPFTLYVDATGRNLPVGDYTAQTWVFGTATNSPYKLYVNLTVTEPLGVDAPLNLVTVAYDSYLELAWDPVDGANSYHIYVSDSPYGTFQNILNTESNSAEFTWAQISAMGFPGGANCAFFKVTADTAPARQRISTSKSSSPTLSKLYGTDRSRVLYRSE